jgi:hypothetical protein
MDDGSDSIAITIATLRNPSLVVPGKQHSFKESAPDWWKVTIDPPQKAPKPTSVASASHPKTAEKAATKKKPAKAPSSTTKARITRTADSGSLFSAGTKRSRTTALAAEHSDYLTLADSDRRVRARH